MRRKNDKIIVFGMIAVGVLAMVGVVAILGIGTYVYTSEKPSPTPAPTPTAVPVATAMPVTDLNKTFEIKKVLSDGASRTYTLDIGLKPGVAPVDMSKVTVQVVADGKAYDVWDFSHGEHISTGNGDVILSEGETFTLTIYLPQAKVPLQTDPLLQVIILVNGQQAMSRDVFAV
ncbi:MAG: hypothetical protein WBZ29_08200 [Methanocella sp.]